MGEPARSNGYDQQALQQVVAGIESLYGELASLKGAYMADCGVVRERMAAVYEDAKSQGIPKKELKALIQDRALIAKRIALLEDMEADERDNFEKLREDLGDFGDLPLGAAALARAKPRGEEQLDALLDEPPAGRKDETELEHLGRGA